VDFDNKKCAFQRICAKNQMRVFVFGCGGYIGLGVARAFRAAGHRVFGLIRSANQANALIQEEITPVFGAQNEREKYESVLSSCAVIVDAIGMTEFSAKLLEICIEAPQKLIKERGQAFKPVFIFTSGIMTYGSASEFPVDEMIPPKPMFPDMTERQKYEEKVLTCTQLNSIVIRPGFVYGGNGGVIATMFFGVDPEADLVLQGRKDKRWSWVHVDDLGRGFVSAAEKGSTLAGQLFNISAQDNPTYEELRMAMAKAAGWKGGSVKWVEIPSDQTRVLNWETSVIINPAKARALLDWVPYHVGFLAELDVYYQSWKLAQGPK